MNFHQVFEDTIKKFPHIRGMIFSDPDGESIVHYNPGMSEFEVRLTGAKVAVMVQSLLKDLQTEHVQSVETETKSHYVFFQTLDKEYSLTVVAKKSIENQKLREFIVKLSNDFNSEIV